MRYGLYRVRGIGAFPDDVRVDDDGISSPMMEYIYRARGYKPLVEDLPWEEDYLLKQAKSRPV